jgi:uncharacterized membrane protein YvlD (DUF360 family)
MMTVTTVTPAFARPRLDVGKAFKGGWNAFTADIVALLVGALIAGLLSIVTLGILAGPLTAGLYTMVIGRVRDGRPAQIGDVFSCMNRFWGFLWAAIVLVVLIALASLTIVGGVLLATIWIYVFPFMVDRKMGLTEAMSASYHQVVDNGFWEHFALLVVFFAIGAVANGWVGILTTPFTIAVIVGAYFVAGGRGGLIDHPVKPIAPAAPAYATAAYAAPATATPAHAAPADTAMAPAPPAPLSPPAEPAVETTTAVETAAAGTATVETTEAQAEAGPETVAEADADTVPEADAGITTETVADAPAAPEQPAKPAPEA